MLKKTTPQKNKKEQKEKITEEKPKKMVFILKDKFKNPQLFDMAVQLAKNGQKAGYERLEFLGDRVVGIVVAEMLYKTFPNEPEGDLAKRFVQLVCAKTLAKIATLWGINDIVKNEDKKLGHSKNVLSDVCEALLGGLYLDSGLEAVKEIIKEEYDSLVAIKFNELNYKNLEKMEKINSFLRNHYRKTIKNKPKEITGSVLIRKFPTLGIDSGRYVINLDFFLECGRIVEYSVY